MSATTYIYERSLQDIKRIPLLISDARNNVAEPGQIKEENHGRVKAATPTRQEIPDTRPPTHWGINE